MQRTEGNSDPNRLSGIGGPPLGQDNDDNFEPLNNDTHPPTLDSVKQEFTENLSKLKEAASGLKDTAGELLGSVGKGCTLYVGGPPPSSNPKTWGTFLYRAAAKVGSDLKSLGSRGAKKAGNEVVKGGKWVGRQAARGAEKAKQTDAAASIQHGGRDAANWASKKLGDCQQP